MANEHQASLLPMLRRVKLSAIFALAGAFTAAAVP
jgi:hypothetical protein